MDTRTIRKAVLQRPFNPFSLGMNDGRVFRIPHPEFVAVSRNVVMVIDEDDDSGVYLEPILIASLKYDDEKQKSRKKPKTWCASSKARSSAAAAAR